MELLLKLFRFVQIIEPGLKNPGSDSFWNLKGYLLNVGIGKSRMELLLKLLRFVQITEPGLKDPGSDSFWNLRGYKINLGFVKSKMEFFLKLKGETRCKEVKLLSPGVGGPFGWHLSFLKGGMAANLVAKQCWGNGG